MANDPNVPISHNATPAIHFKLRSLLEYGMALIKSPLHRIILNNNKRVVKKSSTRPHMDNFCCVSLRTDTKSTHQKNWRSSTQIWICCQWLRWKKYKCLCYRIKHVIGWSTTYWWQSHVCTALASTDSIKNMGFIFYKK